jgi:hypothetical protein
MQQRMRAKVRDIHPASSSASAMTDTGIQTSPAGLLVDLRFSMFTRVVTNCGISSLVSTGWWQVIYQYAFLPLIPKPTPTRNHDPHCHGLPGVFADSLVGPVAGAR